MAGKPSPVVITGMGMVTPVGNSAAEVVKAMRSGLSGIAPVTVDERFSVLLGTVASVPGFDAHHDLQPDRSAAFALAAAGMAWDQAGGARADVDPWRVATVIGSSKGRIGNLLGRGSHHPLAPFDLRTFPGDTLGLDVARHFGFYGPVLNCPAACATGIACLIRGVQALQSDEADMVLAGSAEAAGRALLLSAFRNMGALSDTPMRPFDVCRNGFNPGEGGAVFVLEREQDARARGAEIIARVAGWDQRSDASHITAADPTGNTVAYAITRALQRAEWVPADVDYINAHGTATPLNDVVEGRAIIGALGSARPPVSALKPYIGHLLGASSAVELAMTVACAGDSFLPPTLGLETPDPEIPLHFINREGKHGRFSCILKLSLGFGGHIGVIALDVE